jgi:hypothetical protein
LRPATGCWLIKEEETPAMAETTTCKAASCDKAVRAKGYCDRHYRAWRKGKLAKPRHTSCNETGCGKAPSRRGLCPEHFSKHFGKKKDEPAAEAAAS